MKTELEKGADGSKKRSPKNEKTKKYWNLFIDNLDRIFSALKIRHGDRREIYNSEDHSLEISKTHYIKEDMIGGFFDMIFQTMIPEVKRVMYQDEECYIVKRKNVFKMGAIFFRENDIGWKNSYMGYINNRFPKIKRKVKKEFVPQVSQSDLEYMYYDKKMTAPEIGELVGLTRTTIETYMKHYDIPMRSISKKRKNKYIDPNKLFELYYEQDFTYLEISKILNVTLKEVQAAANKHGLTNKINERRGMIYNSPKYGFYGIAFASFLRRQLRKHPVYMVVAERIMEIVKGDPWPEGAFDKPEYKEYVDKVVNYKGNPDYDK